MSTDAVRGPKNPRPQPNTGGANGPSGDQYGRRKRTQVTWRDVDDDILGKLVTRLCDNGYGLVLGKTSDGGALSVTILDGDERVKDWPTSKDDFAQFVDWALQHYGVGD